MHTEDCVIRHPELAGAWTFVCAECGPFENACWGPKTHAAAVEWFRKEKRYDVVNGLCWQCSAEGQAAIKANEGALGSYLRGHRLRDAA